MALIELPDAALDTAAEQARAAGVSTAQWVALAIHCHAHPVPADAGMDDMGFPSPLPPAYTHT